MRSPWTARATSRTRSAAAPPEVEPDPTYRRLEHDRSPGSTPRVPRDLRPGTRVPLLDCPHWLPGDIPHDRAAHLNDVNGGTYDGFGIGQFGDPWAYTQFDERMVHFV